MVNSVNHNVREAVIVQLHRKRMTRRELAQQIGMDETYLSRLINGDREGGREAWEKILDALDLELTAVPKEASNG
jgi:DNA-binding Xre family transcriptional regulator